MPVINDCVGLTIDRIILATDFSEGAEVASELAEALGKRFAAEIAVTHVISNSVAGKAACAIAGVDMKQLQRVSNASLEAQRLALESGGSKARTKLLESDDPVGAVCDFAENSRADLVVCGTSARRGVERAMLGSFAERLILKSSVPVLTVGPGAKEKSSHACQIGKVLFATDLDDGSVRQAQAAAQLAKEFRAKILLCHVLKRESHELANLLGMRHKFEAELRHLLPAADFEWCSPECVLGEGLASEYIVNCATNAGVDLVVLGTPNRAAWTTHLTAGTTGRILREAPCPVLTIR